MEGIIRELKSILSPDRLGIMCSLVIIVFSLFATQIDNFLIFLFGASAFCMFFGMSFNAQTHTKENITEKGTERITWHELYFTGYPEVSKVLFWIAAILFGSFLIRAGILVL
ncbi:MAG: hypothetical protein KJ593_07370 [Candidatus Omnitrophica bacterium]|nr:hypothetical protein [Candidatus Omnitrophota bacterium]